MNYEMIQEKRHEARLQELRQERQLENKRLDKLKTGLQMKLAVDKSKAQTGQVQAA